MSETFEIDDLTSSSLESSQTGLDKCSLLMVTHPLVKAKTLGYNKIGKGKRRRSQERGVTTKHRIVLQKY